MLPVFQYYVLRRSMHSPHVDNSPVIDSLNQKIASLELRIHHHEKEREILIGKSSAYKDSVLSERAKRIKAENDFRRNKKRTYSSSEIDSAFTKRYGPDWDKIIPSDTVLQAPISTGVLILNELGEYDFLVKVDTMLREEIGLLDHRVVYQDSIINNVLSTDSLRVQQINQYDKRSSVQDSIMVALKNDSILKDKKLSKVTKQRNASLLVNFFQLLLMALK